MKNKITATITTIIVLITITTAYITTQNQSNNIQNLTESFNLIFKYGVGAKNQLNTHNNTYTKDMITDPSITINLKITNQEKLNIIQKIDQINFYNISSSFPIDPNKWQTPQVDYYIKVQNGSEIKEVNWNENSLIESNIKNNLDQLRLLLINTIEDKAEYKALPSQSAGYL